MGGSAAFSGDDGYDIWTLGHDRERAIAGARQCRRKSVVDRVDGVHAGEAPLLGIEAQS
jgi:hypothetical protein